MPTATRPPAFAPTTVTLRTLQILTLAACGMAALLALLPAAGHDQMWLLYAARLALRGAPLYGPQIFETNPPLIVWLSSIPSALATLTGLPDTAWGKFFVLMVEAGVAVLCLRLLRMTRPSLSPAMHWVLAFAYVTAVAVLPARDFGQRDHFLILFLLPYLFAAAARVQQVPLNFWLGAGVGTLALAGVALKPHQLLIVVAVELYLLRQPARRIQRLLRPEILAMLAAGLVFLLAIQHFAPLYFSSIVPIERDTYWAYGGRSLLQLFGDAIELNLLGLVCLALFFRVKTSHMTRILLLAGAAATLAYFLQGTGWYYHQLPALTCLTLALAFLLLDRHDFRIVNFPLWMPAAAAALSLLALALTTHFMGYPFTAARSFPVPNPDPSFFVNLAPGTPVLTLSPTIDDTLQPIYKYNLTLAQRYPSFLMLPALLRSESGPAPHHVITPARLAELDRMQHRFMIEDLTRWHPQLILVERCQDPQVHCQVLEDRHDDLLAWFLRDPAFVQIFTHYHRTQRLGAYDGYALNPGLDN